jgi:hypothetical protein
MKKTLALVFLVACGGAVDDPQPANDVTVSHPIPTGPAVMPLPRTFATSHVPQASSHDESARTIR